MKSGLATPCGRSEAGFVAVKGLFFWLAWLATLCSTSLSQTFQELHAFTCIWNDDTGWDCTREGVGPECALVQARDGNFYGTTTAGGRWGCGTVFRVTPKGEFTTLADFDGTNGCTPYGALLQASDGNLYGTALQGGTLFRFTPPETITRLGYTASSPRGDLVEGPDGKLYGVCQDTGFYYDHGMVFRADKNGHFDLLHLFQYGGGDGLYPSGGLLLASDGYFYGVTTLGGAANSGTVYRISTNGDFATVASFLHLAGNAEYPNGRLLEAPDGSLYGTANSPGHVGAIFRITRDGTLTTMADFRIDYGGEYPVGPLVLAQDGYFYGACYEGGHGYGTVFRMSAQGSVTLLFSFTGYGGHYSGVRPYAGLVQGRDGNLYGTTKEGGAIGGGNVFRIVMPGPLLNSTRAGGGFVLSWRTNYTDYFLQSSTDPARNNWTDCTNSTSVIGGEYFVTNSISGPARFFRLSRVSQPAASDRKAVATPPLTTVCLDGGAVCRSTNAPPYYGWNNDWWLTPGHFDGDIDEVRISNVVRP